MFLLLLSAGSAEVLNDSACPAVVLIDNEDDNSEYVFIPYNFGNLIFIIEPEYHDTNLQFIFQPPLIR